MSNTILRDCSKNISYLVADSSVSPQGLKWAVDPVADVVTTAGDLLYATAADTVTRLGIGTAGQVLKVNSGATAPEWGAAPAGGGKVLQVIQGTDSTVTTITSTSYVTTGLSATITPSSASSKVLIMFTVPINTYRGQNEGADVYMSIYDGTSHIFENRGPIFRVSGVSLTGNRSLSSNTASYLHSPATTSAITYTIYAKIDSNNSDGAEFNAPSSGFTSTIILMEIGA